MKRIWKKGLSFVLAVIMVMSLMPTTAFAAVDSSGKPTDLNNTLVLSIYTPEGSIPGEPATHGSEDYVSFNSKFNETTASGKFLDSAATELKEEVLNDLVQGASNGKNTVWGVFSADGLKEKYFKNDANATIVKPENEAKIIKTIKGDDTIDGTKVKNMTTDEILENFEIIWYVIKLQHSPGSWWWSSGTTEWHIDGVIRRIDKTTKTITINYYGNGNTEGSAPDGVTDHIAGEKYIVSGQNNMKKKINGVYVDFLGWSAKADGTGAEAGFYQAGAEITPSESLSLYAMWDTTTQYTATVNTYLDGKLTSDDVIHGTERKLYLGTDDAHYYELTEGNDGVYTVKITGNGKFHLYTKNADGSYTQLGNYQLTIYNQNASLDVHHYSVTYDANGGEFASPEYQNYYYGDAVTAADYIPVKEGYRFLGWKNANGDLIQKGESVTSSIVAPITLTAQWEKTVNVTINVTVDHKCDDNGYDQNFDTMDDVLLELVSRADASSAYLETGDVLVLSDVAHTGFEYSLNDKVTKYTADSPVYTDMPGGTVEYTVVTSKSGYDTSVTATQDADGNWTIDVQMVYNPTNFDFEFTVEVDENVPDEYVPDAAIVKVTYWNGSEWAIITQHGGGNPGVRVNIGEDRIGTGSYPVWKYWSGSTEPYGYRIVVTAFVYADGTIVPADSVETDVEWSDEVYNAEIDEATGRQYGALYGPYYSDEKDAQDGVVNAVITIDLHDVIFDAQGGKVNNEDRETVEDQYKIPAFKGYVPVRDGGYIFDGWYMDEEYTIPATEGENLKNTVTLYAKWIEPLTITGTVTILGTYQQDGETVNVHDIDKATEALIVLQEIQNGTAVDVDSYPVSFEYINGEGNVDYIFDGIPNDGKSYQIHALLLNYNTTYENEGDDDVEFNATEYTAVFNGDNVADIDVHMEFVPPSYDQNLKVDATQIGEDFRPENVLSEVMYRDTGDNHAYQRISQHDVAPYGVEIGLDAGLGKGTQSIWKWHTDGTLYDYQMNITEVDGVYYNSDTAPFYIVYDEAAYWDGTANAPSADLKATLIPNQYLVSFDLNAGDDAVGGMDEYLHNDGNGYYTVHTWSFDTAINAVPVREGYVFLGWTADASDAYSDDKILASTHQDVVLTAQWQEIVKYTVTTTVDPAEGGTATGDATGLVAGDVVTVTATPAENYMFEGWYENGVKVSENAEYTFEITGNHELTAKFVVIPKATYTVNTVVTPDGTGFVTGSGTYEEGTEIVLTAEAIDGYSFEGWHAEDGTPITTDAEFSYVVTGDRTFEARFTKISQYKNDYAYIFGYTDTVMGAEGPLLRSEAAAMVHRLAKQNGQLGDFIYDKENPSFTDIYGEWFQSGIEYIHYRGGFTAKEGTAVNGYVQITRGEAFRIIALGLGFTDDTTLTNRDYGALLASLGYITDGSGEGDFAAGSFITRAEFCEMYNKIIGRENALLVDKDGNEITAETYGFTDLDPNAWYYEIILRATSAYDENGYVDVSLRQKRNDLDDYN